MKFIIGPIVIVLSILLMKYTVQVTNITGKIGFAEKYLAGGIAAGTYTWWRLVGLAFIILSLLWMTGIISLGPAPLPSNDNSNLNSSFIIKLDRV